MVVVQQILRAADAEIFYPVRSWACAGGEYSHACR